MFKCGICKKTQPPQTKLIRRVVEARDVKYAIHDVEGGLVKTTRGYETVREVNVCPKCATLNLGVAVSNLKEVSN